MSVISALLGGLSPQAQTPGGTTYRETIVGGPGVPADDEGFMAFPTVYACVRLLSETVGTLPCLTFRRAGDERLRVSDDPRVAMLHSKPNPRMTAVEFYESLMASLNLWGNAYVFKQRAANGMVEALWMLPPAGMRWRRDEDGTAWYALGDSEKAYPAADVIHFRGFGPDGLWGYSPVSLFRRAMRIGKAQEFYAAGLFENQARPGGVLKTDKELSDAAFDRLKAEWNSTHEGVQHHGKTAFLEGGVTWEALGMPPEDAQFLEQRKFQGQEIARIFRVPPHMVGDLDRATFSNIEQQSIDFVTHSIRPWLKRIEARLTLEVFDNPRDADLFCEFRVDALLRGETKSRYEAFAVGLNNGFLTTNEVRQTENLPSVAGGDQLFKQLNTAPLKPEPVVEDGEAPAEEGSPIYGYDLDAGIVTIDERRKQLGLPPLPNGQGAKPPVTKNAAQTEQIVNAPEEGA